MPTIQTPDLGTGILSVIGQLFGDFSTIIIIILALIIFFLLARTVMHALGFDLYDDDDDAT